MVRVRHRARLRERNVLHVRRVAWLALHMGSHSGTPKPHDQRFPIADVLAGFEVHPLEPGETALEAFVLVKVLDSEGNPTWSYRTTNPLNREELLGALSIQVAILTKELRDEWNDDEE